MSERYARYCPMCGTDLGADYNGAAWEAHTTICQRSSVALKRNFPLVYAALGGEEKIRSLLPLLYCCDCGKVMHPGKPCSYLATGKKKRG